MLGFLPAFHVLYNGVPEHGTVLDLTVYDSDPLRDTCVEADELAFDQAVLSHSH